ncbi:MAG: hypothetical protein ABW215_13235, partial [Kibdelosporangium sp.]
MPGRAALGSNFGRATLTQFAALPAETYLPASEPSGAALGTEPVNGITLPFADQPIQGFSSVVRNLDGSFGVLTDNGYGNQADSADFALRINQIAPNFGSGAADVLGGIPDGPAGTPNPGGSKGFEGLVLSPGRTTGRPWTPGGKARSTVTGQAACGSTSSSRSRTTGSAASGRPAGSASRPSRTS